MTLDSEPLSEIRAFWQRDGQGYDASAGHGTGSARERERWSEWLAGLGSAPMRVIDVGSGTGFVALLAAEIGHDVAAVDWSEGMQAAAKEKALAAGLTIQFVLGRAEDLPCPDASADAVVARHVLWTLLDPVTALREWRRVLRPGGAVLADMSLSVDRSAHYSPEVERSLPLHQVTDPDIVLGMFAAAGFADATVELVDRGAHQHGASGLFRAVK